MKASAPPDDFALLPQTRFAVPGMRCAGCIAKLENGLALAPGIVAARVNFTAKSVTLTHLPETALPQLRGAIERLGFEAQPLGEALASDSDSKALLKALAVAGFGALWERVQPASFCRRWQQVWLRIPNQELAS